MTRLSSLLILGLGFLTALTASAQGRGKVKAPNISVNVDREPLVQGEPFKLQITIETEGEEPDIRLPTFGGLRVLQQYESHPSSIRFSFGFGSQATNIRKETAQYTFVMMADKPGTYKINPVVVTIGGQRFKGNAYKLEVIKGTGSGSPGGGALTPDPSAPDPAMDESPTVSEVTDLEGAKVDPEFFLQTAVSKKEAYVGEMLTMTIYLYMSRQFSDYDILREPGTEGFWGENLIPSNQRHLKQEGVLVGGRMYTRIELRKMVLFPIKPGELTIAPTIVEIETQRGIFFSKRRAVKRASLPVTVKVLDLPTEDQPPSFNPANVGRFSFSAKIDNAAVKVGEPVTLTIAVRGEGNLRNLVLPTLEDRIDGLKIYAPETDVDVTPRGETVTGISKSRILMIPKKAGVYTLPKLEWTYFDPATKRYKTLSSKAHRITVSSNGEQAVVDGPVTSSVKSQKAGQDRLNRQLRSVPPREDLTRIGKGSALSAPWFLILFFSLPLVYSGVALASRTRRKLAESRVRNRSKNAESESLKRLRELERQTDLSTEQFFAELARCLIGFIEDRLEVKAVGDTMTELRERLTDRGFSRDQAEKVVTEMETLDFARFAKGAGQDEERRQAGARVEALIKGLAGVKVTPKKKEKK